MAEISPERPHPWIAFAAGAVVALVAVLIWMAWSSADRATDAVRLSVPAPSIADVPLPRLPDAPRIPDAPLPTPR